MENCLFMKTRIQNFSALDPIILSGMSWISVPKMVCSCFQRRRFGILATGPFNAEQTRQAHQRN